MQNRYVVPLMLCKQKANLSQGFKIISTWLLMEMSGGGLSSSEGPPPLFVNIQVVDQIGQTLTVMLECDM